MTSPLNKTPRTLRRGAAIVSALALTLGLAACSSDDATSPSASPSNDQVATKNIKIAVHNGWDEGIATSFLFKSILESEGYTVETKDADPVVVYTGLASGDYDVNFDMWLPITHEDYLKTYGDDLEMLGVWYDQAKLTIVVNEDAPITSLDELAANADKFGNKIVGIEAGAGLTRITQDVAIPEYGLEDMNFLVSSTPAMLSELKSSKATGENVVATLWRPHWAYDEFPIRDLEDPKNAMGDPEEINSVGRTGFTETFPEVASWIKAFKLTDEQLFSLENLMFNENAGEKNDESVATWLAMDENKSFVDDLKAAAKS